MTYTTNREPLGHDSMGSMEHLPSTWHHVSSIPPNTCYQVAPKAQKARQCQWRIYWGGGRRREGKEKETEMCTSPEMPNECRHCVSLRPRRGYQESIWGGKAEKNNTYSSKASLPPNSWTHITSTDVDLRKKYPNTARTRLKMKASEDPHPQIRYEYILYYYHIRCYWRRVRPVYTSASYTTNPHKTPASSFKKRPITTKNGKIAKEETKKTRENWRNLKA